MESQLRSSVAWRHCSVDITAISWCGHIKDADDVPRSLWQSATTQADTTFLPSSWPSYTRSLRSVQLLIQVKPGIQRVQALADISRSALRCYSNETRAPITNPPNSAQLECTPTMPPSYIRVRAVVWECGEGRTDRHTDGHGHCTFRLDCASREM